MNSTFEEPPPVLSTLPHVRIPISRSDRDDAYVFEAATGKYEFVKGYEFLMRVYDSDGTPVVFDSMFTIVGPSANGPADWAVASKPKVLDSTMSHIAVSYDLSGREGPSGEMLVTTAFRPDGPPKISATFHPNVDNEGAWSIVWAVRLPAGLLESPSGGRLEIGSIYSAQPPWTGDWVRLVPVGSTKNVQIDWSDASLPVRLRVDMVDPAKPQYGSLLGIRFPLGELTIDPTISATSTDKATAYSTQHKLFFVNGVYWAFWHDAGVKYAWSKDAFTWSPVNTVPNTADVTAGFDVAIGGETVAIAYVPNNGGTTGRFLKGQLLYEAISWNVSVQVHVWDLSTYKPASVVIAPTGIFASFVGGTSGGSYWVFGCRSVDGGATWTVDFSEAADSSTVPILSTGANGTVYSIWATSSNTQLKWKWYGSGGWSSVNSVAAFLASGWTRENRVTVVAHPDGKVHVFWIDIDAAGTWQYVYRTRLSENTWTGKEGAYYTTSWGTSGYVLHPTVSIDPNGDWHLFFVASVSGTREISYLRESLSDPVGPTTPIDPTNSPDPAWLSAVSRSQTMVGLIWTRDQGSSWAVDAALLPLPSVIGPATFDPWSRSGISPYQSYFSQLADTVNPGTGMLTVKQDDLVLPGRGLDLSITRMYQEPRVFLGGSPYLYEASPYADLGPGWSLNFPWVGTSFLHLWDGQSAQVDWDLSPSGTVFVSKGAEGFKLDRTGPGYMLTARSGTRYYFNYSSGKVTSIVDLLGNTITFNYASGRIFNITDAMARVVSFAYDGSNRLWTVSTGSRTVTYGYTGNGQLSTASDPMNRVTSFQYLGSTGANAYLMSRVTYPTGGNTRYSYGTASPIKVGTEAVSYPITLHEVYLVAGLVRSTSYAYEAAQGRVEFLKLTLQNATAVQGYTEYNYRKSGLYSTTTKFNATHVQLEKSVSWYGPQGAATQTDVFTGTSATPSFSSTSLLDEWGNQISGRDPIGHETFASYANTQGENSFRGAGELKRVASGRLFYDGFDDFDMSDWQESGSGGDALIDNAVYEPSSPGMQIYSTALNQIRLANHSVATQGAAFVFEARVRMGQDSTVPGFGYLLGRSVTSNRVNVAFRDTLQLSIWNGAAWVDCAAYVPFRWYRVTVHVVPPNYDVYLDGLRVCFFAPLLGSGNIDNLAFEAADWGYPGRMWVDEVKAYGGSAAVTIRGLRVGQVAELLDPAGVTADKQTAKTTTPSTGLFLSSKVVDLTGHWRMYELGAATIRVYSAARTLEYASPSRDFWGDDAFVYTPPVEIGSLARTEPGFGRWSSWWLDDHDTPGTYIGDNDTWIWQSNGEAPVLGTEFHRSPWMAQTHRHHIQDAGFQGAGSGEFIVQYVRVESGQYPAEVMLEFRVGTSDPQSWDHRAYWGGNYILLGTDGNASRKPMGAFPYRPGEWVMLTVKADDVAMNNQYVNGMSYVLYGGAAFWDASALADSNTGLIRVTNLGLQKVELTDPGGAVKASYTVTIPDQGTAKINVYAAGINAFPYKGKLRIYASDGVTLEYVSPVMDFFGGDKFVYTAPDFYVNSVPPDVRNRVVGNLAYRTTASLDPGLQLNMQALRDLSFNGNLVFLQDAPTSVPGVVGNALRFDGTNDGVKVPDAPSLDAGSRMTLSLWIKPEAYVEPSTSNPGTFISKWYATGVTPPGQFVFGFSGSDGKLKFTAGTDSSAAGYSVTGNAQVPLNVNAWSHVAAVFDEGAVSLYLNGKLDSSGSLGIMRLAQAEYSNDDVWIGRQWSTAGEFTGAIDEVLLTDRALSADDIAVIYRTEHKDWAASYPFQWSYTKYGPSALTNQTKVVVTAQTFVTYDENDAYGNLIQVKDPKNRATAYAYSATYKNAYRTSISEPLGVSASFVYDSTTGMRLQETDAGGGVTDHTYDNLLRIRTTTYPMVGGTRHSISYTYDDVANTLLITDELGHRTKHYFDSIGRETKIERLNADSSVYSTETSVYDWQDRVASQTTSAGLTYKTTYDLLGRITKVTNPDNSFRTVAYDDVSNLVTATDEVGRKVRHRYDVGNRLTETAEWNPATSQFSNLTTVKYDGMGDILSVTDPQSKPTTHVYDGAGRLMATIYPDGQGTYEKYTYDNAGNLAAKRKRDGTTLAFEYDDLNRLKKVTYPNAQTVTYEYDKMGQTKKVVNPDATLWYEYDARGRVTKESSLVGGTNRSLQYGYDGASNLAWMVYPDGTNYTYTPDGFNRVSTLKFGSTTLGTVGYRTDDRLASLVYGSGLSTSYTYDNRARPDILSTAGATNYYTTRPTANGDTIQWQKSGTGGANWDRVDDTVSDGDATYVNATTGTPLDLYQQSDVSLGGASIVTVDVCAVARTLTFGEIPNPSGVIKLALKTNGAVRYSGDIVLETYYHLDCRTWATNPVTGLAWTEAEVNALQAGEQLVSTSFGVRVTQLYVSVQTTQSMRLTLDYGYNSAGDVTSLAITPPAGSTTETFGYDGQDRLRRWTTSGSYAFDHSYAYTAAGDRLTLTEEGAPRSYYYGFDHRITAYARTATGYNATFVYDANGNTRWRNVTVPGWTAQYEYQWDAEDRLTTVKLNSTAIGTYAYDGIGRRVKVTEGAVTTYFVYSGLSLIYTTDGTTTTKFLYASGLLIARVVNGTTSYVHQDALGSVRELSDGGGNWIYYTQYKPFGLEYGTAGSPGNPKFTGQWKDTNTGLYYLYRRFYDPEIGRFFSPDSVLGHLTVPQSLDRYVYTVNNPLRYVDPSGEDWWNPFSWDWGAIGNAVGKALSKINPLDVLDMAMSVLGFIPGLDIISNAYFMGRALIEALTGHGSWADVAMMAAFMLLPVGISAIKKFAKGMKATKAIEEGAEDVARLGGKAEKLAVGAEEAAKTDQVGQITERLASHADEAVEKAELTAKQLKAAEKNPKLYSTFFGERVDNEFRTLVKNDPALRDLVELTPRGKFGPDVRLKGGGTWWDVTTSSSWGRHVGKYEGVFGKGIPLLY